MNQLRIVGVLLVIGMLPSLLPGALFAQPEGVPLDPGPIPAAPILPASFPTQNPTLPPEVGPMPTQNPVNQPDPTPAPIVLTPMPTNPDPQSTPTPSATPATPAVAPATPPATPAPAVPATPTATPGAAPVVPVPLINPPPPSAGGGNSTIPPVMNYTLPSGSTVTFGIPNGDGGFNPNAVLGPPQVLKKTATEQGEPRLWMGGVEFGLNGSEGNSQILKIRFGANATRKSQTNLLAADLFYGFSTQNSERNENKMLLSVRDEILLAGTQWSPFLAGTTEYDEFRDYEFRYASHAGLSYLFWKTEKSLFKGRFGVGTSVEVSPEDTRYNPEGMLGYDFNWRFTDRQRFVTSADFFQDLGNLERQRVRVRGAYEILVDPESNLTLRLGIQERYDSQPGNAKPNDLDFFATLMFRF
ncbi:DUF481 domain-containing protein [Tuwongella immobilis]|uniref:DUF481 domain-containing protein n=1 Tax=Tuwongella immobilis TaxID=692036 RepID=A0A6C2YSD9_9BACT|nr:DUF481 domain-containing protein [Tuwongella immobilis]VIP04059.1 Secreted protein containing DUF481 OS=Rhodopirellula sallentina SM41 GN=RSSM_04742 PE=4 SV=1: DUF481 [Tuwongella immobilis]VTS05485.1 Secreted protein containing DUF481 OS=Rhodopirellula sallentina SM41 GN=RSSM_04742 PE=4 SV=1: DUF481 [Tuwongella immobilis]